MNFYNRKGINMISEVNNGYVGDMPTEAIITNEVKLDDIEVNVQKAKNGKKAKLNNNLKTSRAKTVLTVSLEDYLEKVYLLSKKYEEVRVTDIADSLSLSKPSVNRAVKTLTEEGYLQHAHYGSIELTELGYETARELYRRHRALRQFLILCLGVDKEVAEQEAFGLKHYISDDTCRRLRDFVEEF